MSVEVGDIRCCACGSSDLIAIAPGHEPDRHDLLGLIERGVPQKAWCEPCWSREFSDVAAA